MQATTINFPITIEKNEFSRLNELNLDKLQFGKTKTDHLLVADYYDEK